MFGAVLFFEISYQLRRGSTWIYFLVILGLLHVVLSEMIEYSVNVEQVLINSPIAISELVTFASKLSLLMVAALVADGAMRDTQTRMEQLIYTTPVSKISYLGGRVCGTLFVVSALMLLVLLLTVLSANVLMGADPTVLGPLHAVTLIRTGIILVFPNVVIATFLLYGITWLARHAMGAYAGALVIFILSTFSMEVLAGRWSLAKLLDPFAGTIIDTFSITLLLSDRNVFQIPLDEYLIANRLLCTSAAIGILFLAVVKFRLAHSLPQAQGSEEKDAGQTPVNVKSQNRPFISRMNFFQAFATAFGLYKQILFSPGGGCILVIALYTFVLIPNLSEGPMGVAILPTTDRIVSFMNSSALQIFVAMLISFYGGQLIWREREARMHAIVDAAPTSNGWMLTIKYLSLLLLVMTIQFALLLSGVMIQISNGYGNFQLVMYLKGLFGFQMVDLMMFAAVAMVLHVLVNQKYLGHLVVILFYFYTVLGPRIGLEHKLTVFGSDIGLSTSAFYDQSAYLFPWILFKSYWLGWTLLLSMAGLLFWVRGYENDARSRIRRAIASPVEMRPWIISLLLIVVAGVVVYYNTNVRNLYQTRHDRGRMQATFEQRYGRYRQVVQPYVTATHLKVDFFPEERRAEVSGVHSMKNLSNRNIDSIHVVLPEEVITHEVTFERKCRVLVSDSLLWYNVYLLDEPIRPGDSVRMNFRGTYSGAGFSNSGMKTAVMNDGTYFVRSKWLPSVGYQTDREITDHGERNKFGLPQRRVRDLRDSVARMDLAGRERIAFELVASTTAGQTVVAPGSLMRTWTENGRPHFHYVADSPLRNNYQVYSAQYSVRETKWKDVLLQIYHRQDDSVNIRTMEESMKASLEYYTANFSPYPSAALKLVQYADPGTGGISLPGIIGYSTNFARLDSEDRRGFDLPFAVVAHEVAHQWWGRQLTPANVEGASFLTESLAWYSALCVVGKARGQGQLDFLLAAMRASYYNPRARADVPLLETVDPFKAYRKGPFAMYALREYIGEEKVNLALRNVLRKFTSQERPLTTSLDLYKELQSATPDSLGYLLKDLFASNTIWDFRTRRVGVDSTGGGKWIVRLQYMARKEIVDVDGKVTTLSMMEPVEVGLYKTSPAGHRRYIYLQTHMVRAGEHVVEVEVSEKPDGGGVDPRNLLIDMDPNDNVKKVQRSF